MKTVETKKDMIDENESEEKILSFEELEATVEPLILPCCEFYQTHERTRENHKKCMIKSTSALTFIIDFLKKYDRVETRPEFKTFDSVVCFQTLIFCLERYQPIELSFMRMFVHVYFTLKKAHSRFLFDRMCRVNADIAYHEIRKAIRERMAQEGISGPRATELLHSFFSAETYLFATSRANFFRKKLHLSENQISDFEYTLRANGYVDSLDRIKEQINLKESDFSEFDDSLAPLEQEAGSWGAETEDEAEAFAKTVGAEENADKKPCTFEYNGKELEDKDFTEEIESWEKIINIMKKAFELAETEKQRTYLRCSLTLKVLKTLQEETISIRSGHEILSRLAEYIDKPFLLKHWQGDYSKAYQEISEDERREAMARHLGLEPSTIKTYCRKALNLMTQAGTLLSLVEKDPPPDPVPMAENA